MIKHLLKVLNFRRANLVASGGSGDTFVAYVKAVAQKGAEELPNMEWIPVCSRKGSFTFGEVRSMEFNRQVHFLLFY